MKRTMVSVVVVGLCAGVEASAIAKDTTPGNLPSENARQKPAESAKQHSSANEDATAAPPISKGEYEAAKNNAFTQYISAKAKCDRLQGEAMHECVKVARAARTEALGQPKTQWESWSRVNGTGKP